MIRLNFTEYQKKLKDDKLITRPTEHYYEDDNVFVFMFKSREKHDYYSIIFKSDIINFSDEMGVDEAIDTFKLNYCSNHLLIENIQEIPEVFKDVEEILDIESGESGEPIAKSMEISEGDDMIIEAKDYSEFLLKTFDQFEKKALAAADKIKLDKSVNKTLGEFLSDMFNSINTARFAAQVKRFIRGDLIRGMESAEEELDINIGFTDSYESKLNKLQAQQVDGYVINGKKWPGIKGVTKELQSKLIITVQDGIKKNMSVKEIKEAIQKDFSQFSDWRSNMIARTETNRIINEGKVLGYKESGVPGKKVWSTALDDRTSDICRRLNGQERDLDDDFIDPETMKSYGSPPAHPHCRSSLYFRTI